MKLVAATGKKIVLRDRVTGEYFVAPTRWTYNFEEAWSFANGFKAMEAAANCNGRALEIVSRLVDPRDDVVIPVPKRERRSPE